VARTTRTGRGFGARAPRSAIASGWPGRIDGVARRPLDELHRPGRQPRIVEPLGHRLQRPVAAERVTQTHDHAAHQPRTQRRGHLVADLQGPMPSGSA
jgi:hypothetical protein